MLVFDNEHGKQVLQDLASFCRAKETTFHPDQRVHAALEGRREVYLRIMDHMEMEPEEFFAKYLNLKPTKGKK